MYKFVEIPFSLSKMVFRTDGLISPRQTKPSLIRALILCLTPTSFHAQDSDHPESVVLHKFPQISKHTIHPTDKTL